MTRSVAGSSLYLRTAVSEGFIARMTTRVREEVFQCMDFQEMT